MPNIIGTVDARPKLADVSAENHDVQNGTTRQLLAAARIIFVFSSLELGGAERQAMHLASYLKQEFGSALEIWGFSPAGRVSELCQERGITCRSIDPPLQGGPASKLIGLTRFVKEMRGFRPTVLLPYTMSPNIICGLTWKYSGARVCVWNQRDEGRGRVGRLAEKWAVHRTPLFISNSVHGAEFLNSNMGADRQRVFVVRNGIELPAPAIPRQQWRDAHDISSEHFVACMVANLHKFKDHVTLLQAWAIATRKLEQRGMKATLLLAGRSDGTTQSLKAMSLELKIQDNVKFLGSVSDVSSMLNAADVGVFSSRLEGCPNAVLEYMASPLAVVATDIPGVRESLGSDCGECLTPIGDAEAMATQIIRLALDPSLRSQLASVNLDRVSRLFGLGRMCSETASLIAGALTH